MNISIKSNIKELTLENYQDLLDQKEVGRCWKFQTKKMQPVDIKFLIKGCRVRYTPQKYDKMTVELIDEFTFNIMNGFQDFQSYNEFDVEPFLKDKCLNLKLSAEMKARTIDSLRPGDYIDMVIQYNNVWKIKTKYFASFELLQFKKVEPLIVDLFVD